MAKSAGSHAGGDRPRKGTRIEPDQRKKMETAGGLRILSAPDREDIPCALANKWRRLESRDSLYRPGLADGVEA